MAEQEKTIQTIYGEQTERDVIRTLVGELEHINKLLKWQMDQGLKMRKALQSICNCSTKMDGKNSRQRLDATYRIASAALEGKQ